MTADKALAELIAELRAREYQFTTVTPVTHRRVVARNSNAQPTMRDILGWNRPFRDRDLDPVILRLLQDADVLQRTPEGLVSRVRVSSLGDDLFLHSGFPTDSEDAVFFGPDTYRFARFIRHHAITVRQARRIVDLGTGSGAGGIAAARIAPGAALQLVDINPEALRLAAVNCAAAGVKATMQLGNQIPAEVDLVLANPPYMIDAGKRAYRDGGGLLGGEVALGWVEQALARLESGGAILLYTGVAMVDGGAPFIDALARTCVAAGAALSIDEIDPDVFGEELDNEPYRAVERIAAIGAVITAAS